MQGQADVLDKRAEAGTTRRAATLNGIALTAQCDRLAANVERRMALELNIVAIAVNLVRNLCRRLARAAFFRI
jgi:hypothetical protein